MDLEYNSSWRASLTDSSHVSASPLHQGCVCQEGSLGLDGIAALFQSGEMSWHIWNSSRGRATAK